MQHRCVVDLFDVVVCLGAMFHHLEHECCELEISHHQDGNLIPPVWHLLLTKPPGLLIMLQIEAIFTSFMAIF